MTDPKKIEIAGIKNLELIQFFDMTELEARSRVLLMGLRIIYNNKELIYNYKDIYFEDFVSKVIKTYHAEKDKRKILVMNDTTEKILGKHILASPERVEALARYDNLTDVSMIKPREAKLILLKDYIIETLLAIIRVFSINTELKPLAINGIKDKFVFVYENNGVEKYIPLFLLSVDYTKFKLFANAIEGRMIKFAADIRLGSNSVRIKCANKDESILSEIEYNIEKNISRRSNFINNTEVWHNEDTLPTTGEHRKLLRFYTDLISMPAQSNLMRTAGKNFLCYDARLTPIDEDTRLVESDHIHSRIGRNIVNFRHNSRYSSMKYNDTFLVIHDEIKSNVSFFSQTGYELFDYIVIQRKFIDSTDACGKFKDKYAGKNYYEILKVKKGAKITEEFDILDRFTINKEIKTEDDIRKTMIKRGDRFAKV